MRKRGQLWELRGFLSSMLGNAGEDVGKCGNYFTHIFPHSPTKNYLHKVGITTKASHISTLCWMGIWEDFCRTHLGVGQEKFQRGWKVGKEHLLGLLIIKIHLRQYLKILINQVIQKLGFEPAIYLFYLIYTYEKANAQLKNSNQHYF